VTRRTAGSMSNTCWCAGPLLAFGSDSAFIGGYGLWVNSKVGVELSLFSQTCPRVCSGFGRISELSPDSLGAID
jgi:hypothetical protein